LLPLTAVRSATMVNAVDRLQQHGPLDECFHSPDPAERRTDGHAPFSISVIPTHFILAHLTATRRRKVPIPKVPNVHFAGGSRQAHSLSLETPMSSDAGSLSSAVRPSDAASPAIVLRDLICDAVEDALGVLQLRLDPEEARELRQRNPAEVQRR